MGGAKATRVPAIKGRTGDHAAASMRCLSETEQTDSRGGTTTQASLAPPADRKVKARLATTETPNQDKDTH